MSTWQPTPVRDLVAGARMLMTDSGVPTVHQVDAVSFGSNYAHVQARGRFFECFDLDDEVWACLPEAK